MYKLSINEVKSGMVVEKTIYAPGSEVVLVQQGTALKEKTINKLKDLGFRYLDIADRYTLFVNPIDSTAKHLESVYLQLISKYASEQVEENLNDNMAQVTKLIISIVRDICNYDDVINFCIQMRLLKDKPLFEHSVLTSVLSGLVAGALKLPRQQIYTIMVGGLLHNIGTLEMPLLIGVKDLKGQQLLLWKEHTNYGYYFAIQENIPREMAEIIQSHHERWDGSGYPKQLKGENIPINAHIVGLCANISHHLTFDNMPPYEALEFLYATSNIHFDKKIVDAFIQNITLYPLGALVRITTGEVGIISNVRKNFGSRPLINVYFNRFNKPLKEPKLIDLGKERTVFITELLS